VPNQLILDNLKFLSDQGARIDLRLILVDHVNTSDELIHGIQRWLHEQAIIIEKITLLPYHDFGRDKYSKLGRDCTQNFKKPGNETIEKIQSFFGSSGYCVNVGG
jgi:pyruvate formate lyase activating enzyme